MKIAVSNIAWPVEEDGAAFAALADAGIQAIEVAPTRVWPEWNGISPQSVEAYRAGLEQRGFRVSSLQAVLFGKPELRLFGGDSERAAMKEHLEMCARLARDLGAAPIVFGAPKNRLKGGLDAAEANSVARDFFASVGDAFVRHGVFLCLEANPVEYGCDYLTESGSALELVRKVASPGIKLHLDSACMMLAKESVADAVADAGSLLTHYHASEPFLGAFDAPTADHRAVAAGLRALSYEGWVSIEMRPTANPVRDVKNAVRFVQEVYG